MCLGLHAQKIRVGRKDFLFYFFLDHYFFFLCKEYMKGALKHNVVKFQYIEVINQEVKPSQSHSITLNDTEDAKP